MDLRKIRSEEKLYLCRWYYIGGFFCLPFLWFVNAIWFFNEGFRKPFYSEQAQIRKYVIQSAIGAVVWIIILAAWISVFQLNRADWGELADEISFMIPMGVA